MANLVWLVRRLKAMSIPEVLWRVSQKQIGNREKAVFGKEKIPVTSRVFSGGLSDLAFDGSRLFLNLANDKTHLHTQIHLLSGMDYEKYKRAWHAGFQTENSWPLVPSFSLEYRQRDEIGDARTNWELNRHFQFALLAKDYASSGDKRYLEELIGLFDGWKEENPFLWGISWTSTMEVAIRCSNWVYTLGFLQGAEEVPQGLMEELRIGILNMTDYVAKHYSRYSSANNHLIVEAFVIAQSGLVFHKEDWVTLGTGILTHEFPLQNYSDGINKEVSLHYQCFYMEAVGLMARLLLKNGRNLPSSWNTYLDAMCRYMADCLGDHGEVVVFGDDDEGKILDLEGIASKGDENKLSLGEKKHGATHHYRYVLSLCGMSLKQNYVPAGEESENLAWLYTREEREAAKAYPLYKPEPVASRKEGGVTLLRCEKEGIFAGVDHGELGFLSIAAHGQADALSFQLFWKGVPVFTDPGTYLYHCDLPARNAFRSTMNHNTVNYGGREQSEMLGAFLWGKRAKAHLVDMVEKDGRVILSMEQDGYKPVMVNRTFDFGLGDGSIFIEDSISQGEEEAQANFLFGPFSVSIEGREVVLSGEPGRVTLSFENGEVKERSYEYSPAYGLKETGKGIRVNFKDKLRLGIRFESR